MDRKNSSLSPGTEKKINISFQELQQLTRDIFSHFLHNNEIIEYLADSFVSADLVGHHTHGVASIEPYVKMTKEKKILPHAKPKIIKDNSVGTWVDGQNGYGRYSAHWTMNRAIDIAKNKGKAIVWLNNTSNIGRLGEYAEQCAKKGCIGIIIVGSGNNKQAIVAPPNCKNKFFGTNPISFGFPLIQGNPPFIIDLSLSKTTYHHVEQCFHQGSFLNEKAIIDDNGELTDDPSALFNGGAIEMSEGYKGFCLSLFFTIFAGLADIEIDQEGLGGICFIVLDGNQITNFQLYKEKVNHFLHQCRFLENLNGTGLRVPGDHSQKCRDMYLKSGVPIPIETLEELKRMTLGNF